MKKVLSLVLAFAMILGSFGFVFASNFPDVADTEYYGEPVNVLSGLGVIAGFPDGTFGTGKSVTRAQMATFITAALGIPVKGSGSTGFSDVPVSHWASGYIAYAVSVGFVAGYPDKTFKPENPVSYNEALTMIVAALGYTAETLPGTWPGAFVNKARGEHILDICSTTGNAAAPREDIACFLYKALDRPIGYVDKDGAWHKNEGDDEGNDTMMARLGAVAYNDGKAFTVDEARIDESAINLQNYLGAYITAYANKDGKIIAVKEVKSEFIEGDIDDLKDDYKLDSELKTVDYAAFYNGDQDDSTKWDAAGEIKLAVKLSGKTIKEVYSRQEWVPTTVFMADEATQDEINDTHKLGGEDFIEDEDDNIDATSFALVGRDSLSAIAEDDVVTVYSGKDGITKIEVSDKTVHGVVSKINSDGTAYTIGGTAYDLEDASLRTADVDIAKDFETEGTFYLDYAGKIHHFEKDDDTNTNYAVVLAYGEEGAKYDSEKTSYVKMLLADGSTKEFELKSEAKTEAGFTTPGAIGMVAQYKVNSKGVITSLAMGSDGSFKFDKNGVAADKNMLKSNSVVFSFTGDADEKGDADAYEVIAVDKLYDEEVSGAAYATGGAFKVVLVTSFADTDGDYAFFLKSTGTTKDGAVWNALYDGKKQDLTVDSTADIDTGDITKTTTGAAVLYKLKLDADGIVTKATEFTGTALDSFNLDKAFSVSGNVVTNDDNNYSIESDIAVYVYSSKSEAWTATDKNGLKISAKAASKVVLYKTDAEGDYDIAIVIK